MTKLDKSQVLKNVFNEAEDSLNIMIVAGTASNTVSKLDAEQILKQVYDEDTKTLRVILV